MNPSLVVLAVVGHRVLVHFLEVGEEVALVLVLAVHDRRVDVLDADGVLDDVVVVRNDALAHAGGERMGDAKGLYVLLQYLQEAMPETNIETN